MAFPTLPTHPRMRLVWSLISWHFKQCSCSHSASSPRKCTSHTASRTLSVMVAQKRHAIELQFGHVQEFLSLCGHTMEVCNIWAALCKPVSCALPNLFPVSPQYSTPPLASAQAAISSDIRASVSGSRTGTSALLSDTHT